MSSRLQCCPILVKDYAPGALHVDFSRFSFLFRLICQFRNAWPGFFYSAKFFRESRGHDDGAFSVARVPKPGRVQHLCSALASEAARWVPRRRRRNERQNIWGHCLALLRATTHSADRSPSDKTPSDCGSVTMDVYIQRHSSSSKKIQLTMENNN